MFHIFLKPHVTIYTFKSLPRLLKILAYDFNSNEGISNNSSMSGQTSVEEGEKMGDDYQGSKSRSRNMKSNYKVRRQEKDCLEIKSEVDRYLLDACEDIEDEPFDVLAWWKLHSSKYMILSQLARDVYAIPVSTVAFEPVFSTGGRILDPFWGSLGPKMVEALVCTQNWLRSDPIHVNHRVEVLADDLEYYENVELGK